METRPRAPARPAIHTRRTDRRRTPHVRAHAPRLTRSAPRRPSPAACPTRTKNNNNSGQCVARAQDQDARDQEEGVEGKGRHARVLFRERALAAVLEVDAVRVEVSLGRDDHHLRHRPAATATKRPSAPVHHTHARTSARKERRGREEGGGTHPLSATMQRAPLVGSFRNAKSRAGSQISVSVFGR